MKVLHIIGSIDESAGGPSRSVPQTCEYVSGLGIEIDLISRNSIKPVQPNTNDKFKLKFLSITQLVLFGISIRKKDYNLIHLQHIWDPYIHIMAWIARCKRIPYIITPRGMLEPWIMNRNPWKKQIALFFYQRKDIRKASILHATCDMEKENIKKLGFKNPVSVIPNGIDLFNIGKQKTNFESKKIVFLSRIHEKKGIEILLEAWQKINNQDWVLEIAGEGELAYIEQLKNSIRKNKVENVSFVGGKYNKDKWNFLASAAIFVLPTYSENFGIVVAEALAIGLPVITTTGTPWKELQTEQCGWWIELSIDNLANALEEAINTSSNELQNMGDNGRRLIESKYDITSVAGKIVEMYMQVVNK